MNFWFQKKSQPPEPGRYSPSGITHIGDILTESTILRVSPAIEKTSIIDSLIAKMSEAHKILNKEELTAKIHEREQGISTTLDTGLSIPHARIDNLNELVAGLALLPQGIKDAHQSLPTIRLMFLFLSPNKREFYPQHLQILRKAASLFQTDFIEELNLASPSEALRLIRAKGL